MKRPDYASPSLKSTDFKGKSLFERVYDKHILSPKLHSIQWIRAPESIHDDKGTYVIKEDKDDKSFRVVVKSIADEEYENVNGNSIFKWKKEA